MKTKICISVFLVLLSSTHADIVLNAGQTFILDISDISVWTAWSSPDYPPYNDYSFTIGFNNDLYDSNTDDLRIRLYEEPTDSTPYLAIFDPGQIAANVFTSPTYVKQTQASGTLWYDYTGKMEVEVLSGSVQLDYVWIQLGPGGGSFTGQIDAVPEPNASILFVVGACGIFFYRKQKHRTKGMDGTESGN